MISFGWVMSVVELNHLSSMFQRFCFGLESFASLFSIFLPPRFPVVIPFIKNHSPNGLPSIMCRVLLVLGMSDHP